MKFGPRKGPSSAIQLFDSPKFGSIRLVEISGEPWFVSMDVARILEYSQTSNMTERLKDNEKLAIASCLVQDANSKSMARELTLISEPGLYRAVLGSRKPEAREFETWIVTHVLPQIRKTGAYIPDEN